MEPGQKGSGSREALALPTLGLRPAMHHLRYAVAAVALGPHPRSTGQGGVASGALVCTHCLQGPGTCSPGRHALSCLLSTSEPAWACLVLGGAPPALGLLARAFPVARACCVPGAASRVCLGSWARGCARPPLQGAAPGCPWTQAWRPCTGLWQLAGESGFLVWGGERLSLWGGSSFSGGCRSPGLASQGAPAGLAGSLWRQKGGAQAAQRPLCVVLSGN